MPIKTIQLSDFISADLPIGTLVSIQGSKREDRAWVPCTVTWRIGEPEPTQLKTMRWDRALLPELIVDGNAP